MIKTKKDTTRVSTKVMFDTDLSLEARGLFASLCCVCQSGQKIKDMDKWAKEWGIDTLQTLPAFCELIKKGYTHQDFLQGNLTDRTKR